jgi:MFS family permease
VLTDELAMTATQLSYASAAWFIVFALAQFPIGAALDRIGPRMTAGLLLLVGGAGGIGLFAMAQSGMAIILAMGLIGLGCAPVLMAAFFLFAHEFSEAKFATLAATFVGLGTLGNVAGSEPLAAAIEAYGWRNVGFGLVVITSLVAAGILLLVRDPKVERTPDQRGSVLDVFKIRALWFIFPMILMGYAVAANVRGLWAGPYLRDIYGLETIEIGRITLYMALSLVAGSFAYGPLDRIFNSRKRVVLGGYLALFAVVVWFWMTPDKALWQVALSFAAIGFLGSGYAVQMAHGKAFVPKHLIGRGVTLLNFFSIGGAGIMQAVSGIVVGSAAAAGVNAGYDALFLFYIVTMGMAIAIYAFSTDAKPNP